MPLGPDCLLSAEEGGCGPRGSASSLDPAGGTELWGQVATVRQGSLLPGSLHPGSLLPGSLLPGCWRCPGFPGGGAEELSPGSRMGRGRPSLPCRPRAGSPRGQLWVGGRKAVGCQLIAPYLRLWQGQVKTAQPLYGLTGNKGKQRPSDPSGSGRLPTADVLPSAAQGLREGQTLRAPAPTASFRQAFQPWHPHQVVLAPVYR